MHALGEGFGEAVGKRFQHDAVVIVMVGLELGKFGLDTDAGGDCEGTEVVGHPAFPWRYEIGKALVGRLTAFLHLLAQEMETGQHPGA